LAEIAVVKAVDVAVGHDENKRRSTERRGRIMVIVELVGKIHVARSGEYK
jgi:hypothetical protein